MNKKNIASSIRAKLFNYAKMHHKPFNEILLYYGIERFLHRLSLSRYKSRFCLKGALMFFVWGSFDARPTRDIDFLGKFNNSPEEAVEVCREILTMPTQDDGVEWLLDSIRAESMQNQREYQGIRVVFKGRLDGAVISMQLDVGFADQVYPGPVALEYPTFFDEDAVSIMGYTSESVVAEKLHAIISLGEFNSRMKDYYDVWFLSRQFKFQSSELQNALVTTFNARNTELDKDTILQFFQKGFDDEEEKEVQWKGFVNKNNLVLSPKKITDVMAAILEFIKPCL